MDTDTDNANVVMTDDNMLDNMSMDDDSHYLIIDIPPNVGAIGVIVNYLTVVATSTAMLANTIVDIVATPNSFMSFSSKSFLIIYTMKCLIR
jgi:hypothetical protein